MEDEQDYLLIAFFAWISVLYAGAISSVAFGVEAQTESVFMFLMFTLRLAQQLTTNGCFRPLLYEYWCDNLLGLGLNREYTRQIFVVTSFVMRAMILCGKILLVLITLVVIGYALRWTVQLLPWYEAQRAKTFFAQESFETVMLEVFLCLAIAWLGHGLIEFIRRLVFVSFVMAPMNVALGEMIVDGYWRMSKKKRSQLFLDPDFADISPEGLGAVVRAVRDDVNKFVGTITREPPVMVASFAMFCVVAFVMAPKLALPILMGLVIKIVVHLWVTKMIHRASEREFEFRARLEQSEAVAFACRSGRGAYQANLVSYSLALRALELIQSAGQNLLKELVERILALLMTGYIIFNYLYSGEYEPATTLALIGFAAMSDDFGRGLLTLIDEFARYEPAIRRAAKIAGLHRAYVTEFDKRWADADHTPVSVMWSQYLYNRPLCVYFVSTIAGLRARFFLTF